ncbi:hypothetical protein SCUCBS95973_006005 [Sporothrix curviconia]|uniref:Alternative oxidase n=1 Tax=Sporothrix curviconia TaxID=1260050 RepID=A0ABP0C3N5_9PEZI
MNLNAVASWLRRFSGPRSPPRLRLVIVYSVAVILVVLVLLATLNGRESLPSMPHLTITSTRPQTDLSQPDAPFISWPLARLCRETRWTPGIVFACNNNSGGIGNIRNFVLTCVRYAIAAGATGLVLPQIETRSEHDLAHLFGGRKPFAHFFDTAHFRASLQEACPFLRVYDSIEAIPHLIEPRAEPLHPKALGLRGGCDERDLNRHTDRFRDEFDAMVTQSAAEFALPAVAELHPRLLQPIWGVQWEWPVAKDGPALTNTFGGLLRFQRDILELGQEMAAAMMRKTTAESESKQERKPKHEPKPKLFAGVHLRTESDALPFWPPFATQTREFLRSLTLKKLLAVYLATGNATEASRFRERAEEQGVRVWTKDDLVRDQPVLQQRLRALTWDQQALVDFVVLLRCDYFLGVSPSSFSMTIAAKRHLHLATVDSSSDNGIYSRPWPVNGQGDAQSRLVGNYSSYWDDWLFMYDALWP